MYHKQNKTKQNDLTMTSSGQRRLETLPYRNVYLPVCLSACLPVFYQYAWLMDCGLRLWALRCVLHRYSIY